MKLRRCVTNLVMDNGKGYYAVGQARLAQEMRRLDPETALLLYDALPSEWPRHEDRPYAFKAFALAEAAKNSDLVLWCDASIVPIASMEPFWQQLERDGYFLVQGGGNNYEFTADNAYPHLFPGMPIEQARKINRGFKQIVGGIIGINMRSAAGIAFFDEYYRLARETDAFAGPWANLDCPDRPLYGTSSAYTTARCGPPDVIGHRHDQTAASVIAWRMGLKLSQYPAPYAYTTPGEGTILLHDGPGLGILLATMPPPTVKGSRGECPKCGSYAIGMAGGMLNCNQCGHRF